MEIFGLVLNEKQGLLHRIEPLLEEHILCGLKIKQLRRKETIEYQFAEEIAILEKLQREDEKRLINEIRLIST